MLILNQTAASGPMGSGGPAWLSGKVVDSYPGILGSSFNGSSGFFRGSVLEKDT